MQSASDFVISLDDDGQATLPGANRPTEPVTCRPTGSPYTALQAFAGEQPAEVSARRFRTEETMTARPTEANS